MNTIRKLTSIFNRRKKINKNDFRQHNKSLLANAFMSNDYKHIIVFRNYFVDYNEKTKEEGKHIIRSNQRINLLSICFYRRIEAARLLLNNLKLKYNDIDIKDALDYSEFYNCTKLIKLLQSYNAK